MPATPMGFQRHPHDLERAGRWHTTCSLIVVLSGFWLLVSGDGSIARAEELKIGSVDVARVFDGYNRTKVSDEALEKKGKQKEAELEGRMGELKKLRENLELLSDTAKETKARDIEEKAEELQRFRTSTARDLRRERDKIAKEILTEIQQGIAEYAQANGFAFVVDDRTLLYGQPSYDVTNDVLKLLNTRAAKAP